MVEGGINLQSGIEVPPLNPDDLDLSIKEGAALLFEANKICFTESIDFVGARECTLGLATQAQEASVRSAWDAVGVRGLCPLPNNEGKLGIELPFDGDNLVYVLNETAYKGETVTCQLEGRDGDPDLYVKFGSPPDVTYKKKWLENDCYSDGEGRMEECTTGPAPADETAVYIAVSAYAAVLDYGIKCKIGASKCRGVGSACSKQSHCCGAFPFALTCDGPPSGSKTCKTCLEFNRKCSRSSQCCGGLACNAKTRTCLLAKDPCARATRKLAASTGTCKNTRDCCGTGSFGLVCDGKSATTKRCKPCKKDVGLCSRSSECCPGWKCLNRQCKRG
jgi:Dickkopf N-terminal cysteine-rich region